MNFLLHQAISKFAKEQPESEAFRINGEGLTYFELDRASDQVASWLKRKGVKKGDRVGLFLTKSLKLPIALYGILKAGAVYVPIDPASPPSRVQFLVRDCGIKVLVSDGAKIKFLENNEIEGLNFVLGGDEKKGWGSTEVVSWTTLDAEELEPWEEVISDQDLAYIIYTSGSTGEPKGLMHTHRSGLAYVEMSGELYEVGKNSRLGNHSPLHFDMSTFEYLTGPNYGATTVMIPEESLLFPVEVVGLIRRERLSHWYSVPLALIQLLEQGNLEGGQEHDSMRWVLFGGEALAPKYLHRLRKVWKQAHFSNSYGPAEVNQCTFFHVLSGEDCGDDPLPLGEACRNYELRLVDEKGAFVDEGVGELLVRSASMMRGYWNRPDLTEKAFHQPNRDSDFEEAFYRTGDLVSLEKDGRYSFLGRKDRQIKFRGYRLELDEVESVFSALSEVEEVAVVFGENLKGEKSLRAAITLSRGLIEETTANQLRSLVRKRLPSYGIPEKIQIWTSFPRTGSGKIDRREVRNLLFEV